MASSARREHLSALQLREAPDAEAEAVLSPAFLIREALVASKTPVFCELARRGHLLARGVSPLVQAETLRNLLLKTPARARVFLLPEGGAARWLSVDCPSGQAESPPRGSPGRVPAAWPPRGLL